METATLQQVAERSRPMREAMLSARQRTGRNIGWNGRLDQARVYEMHGRRETVMMDWSPMVDALRFVGSL